MLQDDGPATAATTTFVFAAFLILEADHITRNRIIRQQEASNILIRREAILEEDIKMRRVILEEDIKLPRAILLDTRIILVEDRVSPAMYQTRLTIHHPPLLIHLPGRIVLLL